LDREVGGTCSEVERAYGVPLDRRCLPDGDTVGEVRRLVAKARQVAVTAPVDEEARQLQGMIPAGLAIQLDERHLDLGMAGDALVASHTEDGDEMIQHSEGDVEQGRLARAARLGDSGLEQVAIAVQLVVPGEIAVALLGAMAQLMDTV